eukprot:9077285-Pyramimonas_sp.AAC.1
MRIIASHHLHSRVNLLVHKIMLRSRSLCTCRSLLLVGQPVPPQFFDLGPQPSILGPQPVILNPRPQEFGVFVTLAPRGHPSRVTDVRILIATRVYVIIGAVIVVVDAIRPHNCAVKRRGDKGPSVRSEGATHQLVMVPCEGADAGPVASAPHARCAVMRPSDEGPSVW